MKTTLLTFVLAMTTALAVADTSSTQNTVPGAEQAKARLDDSPRRSEWANIEVAGAPAPIKSWVVYPQRTDNAPVVIVLHEIFGLSDWIRVVADQLAADGFIAVAPDLISGRGPQGGGTESMPSRDAVTSAVRALDNDFVTTAINAVREYALALPTASGKFATLGFCWGGATSFRYATVQPDLDAGVVYYGSSPGEGYDRINAVILGMYGSKDNRVNATIPTAQQKMEELKKPYIVKIYEGASHGFLRQQETPDGANQKAAQEAWPTTVQFLREHTK